jgi:RimJ/RimL family protein N-acetyltransferase
MSDLLTIETPRLLLREWRDEDLQPFSRINADERVCEFLGKTFTPEETRAMDERNRADFREQGFGLWALEVKGGPAFIGYTGIRDSIVSGELHSLCRDWLAARI